jgi:hypothetical protein
MTVPELTSMALLVAFAVEIGWLMAKVQLRGACYKLPIWTSPKGCPAPHPPRHHYPRHGPAGYGR